MGVFRNVSRPSEEEWLSKKGAFSLEEVNLAVCLRSNSHHVGNVYQRKRVVRQFLKDQKDLHGAPGTPHLLVTTSVP